MGLVLEEGDGGPDDAGEGGDRALNRAGAGRARHPGDPDLNPPRFLLRIPPPGPRWLLRRFLVVGIEEADALEVAAVLVPRRKASATTGRRQLDVAQAGSHRRTRESEGLRGGGGGGGRIKKRGAKRG